MRNVSIQSALTNANVYAVTKVTVSTVKVSESFVFASIILISLKFNKGRSQLWESNFEIALELNSNVKAFNRID